VRHILVDTKVLLLHAIVMAAAVLDRDEGAMLMAILFGMFPFLLKLYANGGYQGLEFRAALQRGSAEVDVETVTRSDCVKGLVLLPKRRVVERTLAWLNGCRRFAKDREKLNVTARAFLLLASIRLMVRRICRIRNCELNTEFAAAVRVIANPTKRSPCDNGHDCFAT